MLCKAELLVHGGELAGSVKAFPGQATETRGQYLSLHWESSGVNSWLPILSMSCALTAGDKLDTEKQVYRRKLHSFYEVQEEIGRYPFLTCCTVFQSFPGHSQHGTYHGSPLSFFTPGVCLGL